MAEPTTDLDKLSITIDGDGSAVLSGIHRFLRWGPPDSSVEVKADFVFFAVERLAFEPVGPIFLP